MSHQQPSRRSCSLDMMLATAPIGRIVPGGEYKLPQSAGFPQSVVARTRIPRPPSISATFPTTSTSFPICRCESGFKINVTSPCVPQVIVAVSPCNAVTVPRSRTGGGLRGPEVEGLKACRCEGRTRGVCRDMSGRLYCLICFS